MSEHDSGHQGHDHGHHHEHGHDSEHGHGHHRDQGIKAMLRYLRLAPSMWRSEINDAVLELVDPKPGEQVLDIGAGMGPGTVLAAKAGASVTAVEPTPFMRRVLTARRMLQGGRDRIAVSDGAAEKLPAADGSVDALWSVNAMHHWVDPAIAATEIARVLRPTGRVVLVDEDFADPTHPEYERFKSRHGEGEGEGHEDQEHHGFTMVDAAEMGELLSNAGLTGVEAEKRTLAGRPVIAVTVAR